MICIDLGANVGDYTRMMASVAKQVIAFEPDPWTFDVLQANVADLQNVRLEKVAAGTHESRVLLYRHVRFQDDPASHSGSSSLIASKTNVAEQEAVEVRQIDFIAYLERLNEDIGTLKMDIEGAEVDLLEALLDRPEIMKRIDYIFVETHEARIPGHESSREIYFKTEYRIYSGQESTCIGHSLSARESGNQAHSAEKRDRQA